MRLLNLFSFFLFLFIFSADLIPTAQAYLPQSALRYRLLEDKFSTLELLRPFGHRYYFDILTSMSNEIINISSDASKIENEKGDLAKLSAASQLLRKYNRQEQYFQMKFAGGVPLFENFIPSLKLHFSHHFRATAAIGTLVSLKVRSSRGETIKLGEIPGIPRQIANAFGGLQIPADLPAGTDLAQWAYDQRLISLSDRNAYLKRFFMPDIALPVMNVYTRNDYTFGLFTHMRSQGPMTLLPGEPTFFGHGHLYVLMRTDEEREYTEQVLIRQNEIDDSPGPNTETDLTFDGRWGLRTSHLSFSFMLENLKLWTIANKEDRLEGPLYDPVETLWRLEGMGNIPLSSSSLSALSSWTLRPFAGLYQRGGDQKISEGLYGGLEGGTHFWQDKGSFMARTWLDDEYLTISPNFVYKLFTMEYTWRHPTSTTTPQGYKSTTVHSLFLRFSF